MDQGGKKAQVTGAVLTALKTLITTATTEPTPESLTSAKQALTDLTQVLTKFQADAGPAFAKKLAAEELVKNQAKDWEKMGTDLKAKTTAQVTAKSLTWEWATEFDQFLKGRTHGMQQSMQSTNTEANFKKHLDKANRDWEAKITEHERVKDIDTSVQSASSVDGLNKVKAVAIGEDAKSKGDTVATLSTNLGTAIARQLKLTRATWYRKLAVPGIANASSVRYTDEGNVVYKRKIGETVLPNGQPGPDQTENVSSPMHMSLSGDVIAANAPNPKVNAKAAAELTLDVLGRTETPGKWLHTTLEVFAKDHPDNPKFYLSAPDWQRRGFDGTVASRATTATAMKKPLDDLVGAVTPQVEAIAAKQGDVDNNKGTVDDWDAAHPA